MNHKYTDWDALGQSLDAYLGTPVPSPDIRPRDLLAALPPRARRCWLHDFEDITDDYQGQEPPTTQAEIEDQS